MEELITRTTAAPVRTFKDARLNAAAEKLLKLHSKSAGTISKAYETASSALQNFNREAAEILGKVAAEKSYTLDGFKDIKDFAINGLNFDPRKVYTLVSAGAMYNAENVHENVKALSPDNYEAVKSVGLEALNAAAADGVDFASMTQKQLKEYAAEHKPDKPRKPRVMPLFDITIYGTDKVLSGYNSADMETALREMISPESPDSVEVLKLPSLKEPVENLSGDMPVEREVKRFLYMGNGRTLVAEFRPAVKLKTEKARKADKDRADMIQRMRDNGLSEEQIAAIIG